MDLDLENKSRRTTAILVIAIFLAGVVLHYILGDFTKSLITYTDELIYYGIARSLHMGHGLQVSGAATHFQKIGYSLAMAPLFAIKDVCIRLKAIDLLNSISMVSSVFPVWLIAKECGLEEKCRYLLLFFVIIWPETMISITFMAENLFWPLFFWFVYIWLLNEKKRSWQKAAIAGTLCYAGYLTKEAFSGLFAAWILFDIFMYARGFIDWKKGGKVDDDKKLKDRLGTGILFIVVFVLIHLLLKVTAFKGLESTYNQSGIEAILSVYNFAYMLYAVIYYIAAVLLAMLIIPIVYPIVRFNGLTRECKKTLVFTISFLMITIGGIAYSITVREDLGSICPKLHFRYIGPAFICLLLTFFCSIEKEKPKEKRSIQDSLVKWVLLCTAFVMLVFKGVGAASPVEEYILKYYNKITYVFTDLTGGSGEYIFYTGAMIVDIFLAVFIAIYFILRKKRWRSSSDFVVMILAFMCIVNSLYSACISLKNIYGVSEETVAEVVEIDKYFHSIGTKDVNVVYFTDPLEQSPENKHMDTFSDLTEGGYYCVNDSIIDGIKSGSSILVSDIEFTERFLGGRYEPIDKIDYIILESSYETETRKLAGCEKVEGIGGTGFVVYKNLDANVIRIE